MDYLLPDNETMAKMVEEYSAVLKKHDAAAAALSVPQERTTAPAVAPQLLFALYFAYVLGYNFGYGHAVADSDGDMGRFQSRKRTDGNVDYFFPRKR